MENNNLQFKRVFSSFPEVVAGFTNRWGGVSRSPYDTLNLALHVGDDKESVLQNRNILAEKIGLPKNGFAWMNQVHSNYIEIIEKSGKVLETDGLITNKPGLGLLVLVADCIPILFYDPKQKVVAVAHAGREGSFQNIAGKMIAKLQKDFKVGPRDIEVSLGPSIQKSCYGVDEDIIKRFREQWGEECIYKNTNLDLPFLNKNQLLIAGVKKENIFVSKICNHCDIITQRLFTIIMDNVFTNIRRYRYFSWYYWFFLCFISTLLENISCNCTS